MATSHHLPAFDSDTFLSDAHQGEVFGEALFGLLSELEEDLDRVHEYRLLARLERHVKKRLQPILEERGRSTAPREEKLIEARKAATALARLPHAERVAATIPALQTFVDQFRVAEGRVSAELLDTARFLTRHELALLAFFEREAEGRGDEAAQAIEEFLAETDAPEEEPLPEGVELTPIDPVFRADPNPRLHGLRERAPVYRDRGFGGRVVLTRHDDVMRVLRDPSLWVDPRKASADDPVRMFLPSSDAEREPSMLFLDDPDHRRLRSLVSRSFTPRAVETMRPLVEDVARELLDEVDSKGVPEIDLIEAMAGPLPAIAIGRLLGVDVSRQADFKAWSVAASEAFFNPFGSEALKRAGEEARGKLDALFVQEIERRRGEPSDDLIGAMVAASDEGEGMTRSELVTMCNLLLIAGNVTTTDLIGNGMRLLLEHPDQAELLREEPGLVPNAVEEMLRFDPPVTNSGRIASADTEIDGVPIPKGHSISVVLAAANRDPAVYPEPDRFDVARRDTHHQSFGGGAHLCLGAHLARLEAQVAVSALLQRYPTLRSAGRPLVYKQVPSFRGLAALWARID